MGSPKPLLVMEDLHVKVGGKPILKGLSLRLNAGEMLAIMGPNGSGKSTLAFALMGHPKYQVTKGRILLDGKDIVNMKPNERARLGLFLGFQYPSEIPGVTVANFLLTALKAKDKSVSLADFMKLLKQRMEELRIDESFARRYLNEGFSGGEKKRMEILQMSILQPGVAVLDEIDSGLDIDALRVVADGVNALRSKDRGVLMITHYQRILNYVKPDRIAVMMDGKIVKEGDAELAHEMEKKGYDWLKRNV